MLTIHCPFCGPRSENEYVYGGPVKKPRPETPADYSDEQWLDYLMVVPNPIGPVQEKWWHVRGCGQWLTIERHTLTHDIITPGRDDNESTSTNPASNMDDGRAS